MAERTGKNTARREIAEGLARHLRRYSTDRLETELQEVAEEEGRRVGDARDAGVFVPSHIPPSLMRTWLYSGNREGDSFGPAKEGHIPIKETRTAARRDNRTDDELDRDKLYQRVLSTLEPTDRTILLLWSLAPQRSPMRWVEWIAQQLNAHPDHQQRTNAKGDPWTPIGVRTRVTRINQRIVEQFVAAQEADQP